MPTPVLRSGPWLCAAVGVVLAGAAGVEAAPLVTVGDLADWDPNRPADLPERLRQLDPNAAIIAKDTVDVLPDMLTKMETVILNLTKERTNVRLNELMASLIPDPKKGQKEPPEPIRARYTPYTRQCSPAPAAASRQSGT